ncbi:hypothetical protein [Mesorhizobium amorphae]|uniref:hypothetical protein n=1 Tax=Mesorhizobium amorphae TaxID=71433 RepID=UPI0021B35CA1|nr:hypothetical protein [Mesorhizobium amorphae]
MPRVSTAFALDPSSKKTKRIEDPRHLAFIRLLPSVISGAYGCEACHIRAGSAVHRKKHTGGQQKPDDCWTLPMLANEHKAQHAMEELAFWRLHEIDPFELAAKLYEVSGDIAAAVAIIRKVRP